jgi:hypothetical protein
VANRMDARPIPTEELGELRDGLYVVGHENRENEW